MRFKGKIVLVTGAASGIGLAIARQFVHEGATVIGTDVNDAGLAEIAKESPALVVRKSDAGDLAAIKDLADWIKGEFGALDVLVNNAGFAIYANPEDVEETAFTTQLNVMLTGPVFMVKHLAPLLRDRDNGSVINISSMTAVLSLPGSCPYGTLKEAIAKFTEDCVITVPGVRHNAVLPGFIDTPVLKKTYGEEQVKALFDFVNTAVPAKRMGTSEDIAEAVLFLASDQATYINGARLYVDGGLSRLHAASMT